MLFLDLVQVIIVYKKEVTEMFNILAIFDPADGAKISRLNLLSSNEYALSQPFDGIVADYDSLLSYKIRPIS